MATTSSSDHSLNNLVFSSLLMLFTCCHAQTDTLKPGDTLNYSSSSALLVSSTGKFNLVFNEYSSYCYLVIRWMEQPNDVWNANRDKPVSCTSAALTLDKYKTLRITHDAGEPRVLFSASEGSETTNSNTNVVATLLDSGNFVLREVISSTINGSTTTENQKFLWQSFDYPTTVLLPGMKLGVNRRNGRNRLLTSYLSPENPSSGPFTLEWDPKWCELIIRRRGVVYWSSGAFRAGGFEFLSSYDQSKQLRYNFVSVSNENEAYFTYNITSEVLQGYKSGWVLASDGNLIENLGAIIAQIVDCYGFKSDGGGCQTWGKQISCRNVTMKFETKVGYFQPCTPDSTNKSDSNASLSISDCKAACWEDCSCIGFSTLFKNLSGCKFYTGNWQLKGQDLSGYSSTISFLISNSSLVPGKNNSTNTNNWKQTIEITSISMAAALSAMVLCIACCIRRRRRRRNMVLLEENKVNIEREFRDLEESDRFHVSELQKDGNIGQHDLRVFNYASIMAATANFSKQNKLGEGGFGPVYKGKLMAGREIAVKRLSSCSGQGTMEFQNEVVLISELQHTNLVQLLGFCIHGEERMLIYEYMPNKSLDYFLFDSTRAMDLDWKKRFNIIEGVTQGLLYLHRYSRLRVIHRDLKPSNILLDENMNPKISDFGLARIFTHNELQANTNRVVGTYGYMSPEYAMEGIFSIKSDVYSFGVLMLEIISGRKHNSFYNDDAVSIVGYAWELWREGSWQELIDPKLGDSCVIDQLLRCIHVALLCVEENADDRPTMSNVIAMLTSESTSLALPKKPAFLPRTRRRVIRDKVSEIISVNDMSISDLDVR